MTCLLLTWRAALEMADGGGIATSTDEQMAHIASMIPSPVMGGCDSD